MRKRINSQEKYAYADVKTVALALNTNPNTSKEKALKHPPRPSKKTQSSKCSLSHLSKAICTQKIRQFPNPLLKELRRLVINQIDSGDRLFRSLITQEHKAALQLYSQDRIKLIEYLNSLAIRQVNIDNIKLGLQRKKQAKESKNGVTESQKVQTLDLSAQVNETVRKRCKSQVPKDAKLDGELKQLKKKLKKMQKDWNEINYLKQNSKDKKQENVQPKQNILLQVKELLENALNKNLLKENFVLMQKSEIEALIYLLSQAINRNEELNIVNGKQVEDLEIQLRQKEQTITQLKKQLQQKIHELQFLQNQCKTLHSANYQQLKEKVNHLYHQLSVLVNDVQNKDQLIEYIKGENNQLKNDIEGLEALNRSAKKQQQMLTDYLQSMEQRLRFSEDLHNQHELELNQLRVQLLHKDMQLTTKIKQMRHILGNKQSTEEELVQKINVLQKKLLNSVEQKNLLKLQKDYLKSQVEKLELKLRNIQQECKSYTRNVQPSESTEITLQNRIQNFQFKSQQNKLKNELQDILNKETNPVIYQSNEVIEIQNHEVPELDEPTTPIKVVKNLSMEVNQSYFPINDNQIEFVQMNFETPLKHKTMSQNEEKIFLTEKLERHRESEHYQTIRKSSSKKNHKGPLTEVQDAYQSDDQRQQTYSEIQEKLTFKVSSCSKELNDNHVVERQKQGVKQHEIQKLVQNIENQKELPKIQQSEEKIENKLENEVTVQKRQSDSQKKQEFNQPICISHRSQEELRRDSIVLNQQNQEESSARVSQTPSKMSQSSSRTIFIKWGAKKNIGLLQRNERVKSCTQ